MKGRKQAPSAVVQPAVGSRSILNFDSQCIDLSPYPGILDAHLLEHLCATLTNNDCVTQLNVSNNAITADMAERIGLLLTCNANIRMLTMSNCQLGDPGASMLLRCARKFKMLTSLNMSRNPLGDIALVEVENLIQSTTCLAELVLMDTSITFQGTLPVVQAMVANTSLLYCALPFTLGHALLAEVQKLLERNWQLQHHIDAAAQTFDALNELVQREAHVKAKQWKTPSIAGEGANASHRLRTVDATRREWADPSAKTHLLYLTLLDRKANFIDEAKRDREERKNLLQMAPVSPRQSQRSSSNQAGDVQKRRGSVVSVSSSASTDKSATPRFLQLPVLTNGKRFM